MENLRTEADAIILLGHGSRLEEANLPLLEIAAIVSERLGGIPTGAAFLQLAEPGLESEISRLAEAGAREITVVPFFLYPGAHVRTDIPLELERIGNKNPEIVLKLSEHLGVHPLMADIIVERIKPLYEKNGEHTAMNDAPLKGRWGYDLGPDDIEGRSFEIIDTLVDLSAHTPAELALIKRIIHATGDPSFAPIVKWSPGALEKGVEALKNGAPIVTDVAMAKAGISMVRASKYGGSVHCYISDGEVVKEARERGLTRSVVAVEKAARLHPGAVFVFGNAPTALWRLLELWEQGEVNPSLVIGVVVGFVGAAESKDALMAKTGLPWISVKGNKGGSNVAAAAANALYKIAAGEF